MKQMTTDEENGVTYIIGEAKQCGLTREFLDNQLELCNKRGWPFFMPGNGVCFNCSRDIIPTLVAKGQNGKSELVTGCPLCSRSYCD